MSNTTKKEEVNRKLPDYVDVAIHGYDCPYVVVYKLNDVEYCECQCSNVQPDCPIKLKDDSLVSRINRRNHGDTNTVVNCGDGRPNFIWGVQDNEDIPHDEDVLCHEQDEDGRHPTGNSTSRYLDTKIF